MIGSTGWIAGTNCERAGAGYQTCLALTCAAHEADAW